MTVISVSGFLRFVGLFLAEAARRRDRTRRVGTRIGIVLSCCRSNAPVLAEALVEAGRWAARQAALSNFPASTLRKRESLPFTLISRDIAASSVAGGVLPFGQLHG